MNTPSAAFGPVSPNSLSRRQFVRAGAWATAGAILLGSPKARAATKPPGRIRLGGPMFGKFSDPEEQAQACRALGYRACYCPDIPLTDTARLQATEAAFARADVVLAEVGRWKNLLDADPQQRAANLKYVTEGLALADAVGARCCVDIAGSLSPKEWYGPHPDNLTRKHFDAAVENARKIIDAVKPRRAKFCYEMMGWAHPDGVDSCLRMLRAVDRKSFGVHLDPCNLVQSPERFYRNTALLNDVFNRLGPWIVSCHAKDLVWDVEMNIHFREVRPGAGKMDYETYLKRLSRLPQVPPLMLEHLPNAAEYDLARQHVLNLAHQLGLVTD